MLAHGSLKPASFAYQVGDERKVVELEAGEPSDGGHCQAAGRLTIEPVSGEIRVTTSWREAVKASSLEPDPDVSISRKVTPEDHRGRGPRHGRVDGRPRPHRAIRLPSRD
jgi:hypothetical protein